MPGYEASVWYGIAAPAMIALVLLTELAECPFLTPRWGNVDPNVAVLRPPEFLESVPECRHVGM